MNLEKWRRQGAEFRRRWQQLCPRDRRLAGAMAVLLPCLLIWLVLVEPALQRIDHWQQELPRLHAQARTLEQVLYGEGGRRPASTQGAETRLREGLDSSALAERYQLTGEGTMWRLELHDAPAQAVMDWLLGVAPGLPLNVRQVHLQGNGQGNDAGLSGVVEMQWQAKEPS